jgi:ketosteroid isomerase-like protein
MTSNAARLSRFYAAVEADEIDRAVEIFTPDIEIRTRLESHIGLERCKRMLEEAFSDFDASLAITDLSEPAPDRVMASYGLTLRGRHSQIESSQDVVDVAHFRDGRVYLVEVFSTREEALASLA